MVERNEYSSPVRFRQSLAYNPIGEEGGLALANMLAENEMLEELDIGNCDLKQDTVVHLANVLSEYNSTLRSLNISNALVLMDASDVET